VIWLWYVPRLLLDELTNLEQKIKSLSRSPAAHQAPGSNVSRQPRNLDPAQHPFTQAREYSRALNAVKLERLFAAPFVGQLGQGHVDGVYTMAKDPGSLQRFASGSGDGVLKIWDLTSREEIWQIRAHENVVKDMCWTPDRKLLSCGTDRTVKVWDPYSADNKAPPLATYLGQAAFTSISHHRSQPSIAAASSSIAIYDISRPSSAPMQTLHWPTSTDTINAVSFNQVETSIIASAALDRAIVLYDLRTSSALSKVVLRLSSNAISWNPMEAFNFAVANEDHNVYIFDMRKLDRALNVLKDHVAAVMDIDFSPTGEELVSASYDRTIRLWNRDRGHSRDIYHTKRMQRVFSAMYTPDNQYVLSGSDDGNVRLWRANASSRSGIKSARQRQKREYDEALIRRYEHMPEIRRIKKHRHIPKTVRKAGEIKGEELKSLKRKEENVRKHSKNGAMPRKSEREKMVLGIEK
jgi:DDB1- and CUL4-associated factor 13